MSSSTLNCFVFISNSRQAKLVSWNKQSPRYRENDTEQNKLHMKHTLDRIKLTSLFMFNALKQHRIMTLKGLFNVLHAQVDEMTLKGLFNVLHAQVDEIAKWVEYLWSSRLCRLSLAPIRFLWYGLAPVESQFPDPICETSARVLVFSCEKTRHNYISSILKFHKGIFVNKYGVCIT